MPYTATIRPHVPLEQVHDPVFGLLTQSPNVNPAISRTFASSGDKLIGSPICMYGKLKATADGTVTVSFCSKNCPFPIRVAYWNYTLRSLRTGGAPDHDVTLELGDGAASEAYSTIGTADVDSSTVDLATNGLIDDANALIAADKTIRAKLVVSGTTTTGTAELDVFVIAMRTVA